MVEAGLLQLTAATGASYLSAGPRPVGVMSRHFGKANQRLLCPM
jgi:hypothetical protein